MFFLTLNFLAFSLTSQETYEAHCFSRSYFGETVENLNYVVLKPHLKIDKKNDKYDTNLRSSLIGLLQSSYSASDEAWYLENFVKGKDLDSESVVFNKNKDVKEEFVEVSRMINLEYRDTAYSIVKMRTTSKSYGFEIDYSLTCRKDEDGWVILDNNEFDPLAILLMNLNLNSLDELFLDNKSVPINSIIEASKTGVRTNLNSFIHNISASELSDSNFFEHNNKSDYISNSIENIETIDFDTIGVSMDYLVELELSNFCMYNLSNESRDLDKSVLEILKLKEFSENPIKPLELFSFDYRNNKYVLFKYKLRDDENSNILTALYLNSNAFERLQNIPEDLGFIYKIFSEYSFKLVLVGSDLKKVIIFKMNEEEEVFKNLFSDDLKNKYREPYKRN